MRSDFNPIHLKEANKILSRYLEAIIDEKKDTTVKIDKETSLWKKFLQLFRK